MFKKNQLIKFSAVLAVFAFTAGGIKTIAEQRPSNREVLASSIGVNEISSSYDDTSNVLNRSITFGRQQQAIAVTKAQQVLASSVKASSKTASANTAKSTSKSSSTSKTSIAKAPSAKAKTTSAVAKTTTARSKTVASRGTSATRSTSKGLEIVSLAKRYLGYQYVHGGASPSTGFDCSGFTMYLYSKFSVSLPHSASQQYKYGTRISSVKDLKPGDLVFFFSPISHVGIYIGNGQFIHASNPKSDVKITDMDSTPYNKDFVGAVRIFD
jgi:cell wall-associated NlpC family hydrolase